MGTKNFLFTFVAASIVIQLLTGCQLLNKRTTPATTGSTSTKQDSPTEPAVNTETPQSPAVTTEAPPPASDIPSLPKVAVILGPGGALSYGHIGVLQELARARMPIDFVFGAEWGALPAALYSRSGHVQDSEWQAMKIPDNVVASSGLLSNKVEPNDSKIVTGHLKDIFQQGKVDHFKVPFACLSLDLTKRAYFFRNTGEAQNILPTCMSLPPLFNPDRSTVAAFDSRLITDYLQKKGYKFIVFINVLPKNRQAFNFKADSASQVLWTEWQMQAADLEKRAHYTISLNPENESIESFSQRRALISKGKEAGAKAARELAKRIGF